MRLKYKRPPCYQEGRFLDRSPITYSGRESNPHSLLGEQDFKSCVSTSSTTRAGSYFMSKGGNKTRTRFGTTPI